MRHPNILEANPTFAEQQSKLFVAMGTSADALLAESPTAKHSGGKAPIAGRTRAPDLTSRLFLATADAKIWTSQVAMHLDRAARDRIFRQIDALHDIDAWDDLDKPINIESYKSLVRALIYHKVNSRPALAMMPDGNVLALWRDGDDRLTIEFKPDNQTRWAVQHRVDGALERAAGSSALERLGKVMAPYGASRWFDGR